MAKTYRIHPAIGIARIGNAVANLNDKSTYYLGPEVPLLPPNEGKPYKKAGKIKKQAQRFRIYEYEGGTPIREITLDCEDVAYIKWNVRLANGKAALNTPMPPCGPRNKEPVYKNKRKYLTIDSNRPDKGNPDNSLSNPKGTEVGATKVPSKAYRFKKSEKLQGFIKFKKKVGSGLDAGTTVPLGQIVVQPDGRLLVFGGNGKSDSPNGTRLHGTFDNDSWFDDTSDGIVNAEIEFKAGYTKVQAEGARVVCSVPGYAPAIENFVTLYDVAREVYYKGGAVAAPSFWRDIYPILLRTSRNQWVSALALAGHGEGKAGDFTAPGRLKLLRDKASAQGKALRKTILARLRNPNNLSSGGDMPILYGVNSVPRVNNDPPTYSETLFTLTKYQYAQMKMWENNKFTVGNDQYPSTLGELAVAEQPAALDRAAMDSCTARAFYPGIEVCYRLELEGTQSIYSSIFRVSGSKPAGSLSQGNALPWQTDFHACGVFWWPSQRPNRVYRKVGGNYRPSQEWMQGVSTDGLVKKWSKLGFIVGKTTPAGEMYVETERNV